MVLAVGTLALLGIIDRNVADPGVKTVIGTVTKSLMNPLFSKTEPWEQDINNG